MRPPGLSRRGLRVRTGPHLSRNLHQVWSVWPISWPLDKPKFVRPHTPGVSGSHHLKSQRSSSLTGCKPDRRRFEGALTRRSSYGVPARAGSNTWLQENQGGVMPASSLEPVSTMMPCRSRTHRPWAGALSCCVGTVPFKVHISHGKDLGLF